MCTASGKPEVVSTCTERKYDLFSCYTWTWVKKITQEQGNPCLLGATICVSTWHIYFHLMLRLKAPYQNTVFKHYLIFLIPICKWGNWVLEGLWGLTASKENKLRLKVSLTPAPALFHNTMFLLGLLVPTPVLLLFGCGTWNKSLKFLYLSLLIC